MISRAVSLIKIFKGGLDELRPPKQSAVSRIFSDENIYCFRALSFMYQKVNLNNIPKEVDWMDIAIPTIPEQGQEGNCFAYSAVLSTESLLQIHGLFKGPLSVYELTYCDIRNRRPGGGGSFNTSFYYMTKFGVGYDDFVSSGVKEFIGGYEKVQFGDWKRVLAHQPVSVSICSTDCFEGYRVKDNVKNAYYSGDVDWEKENGEVNHAVNLVGYGTDDTGVEFWKGVNFRGTDWGQMGTFKVKSGLNINGIERHSCSYPIIAKEPQCLDNLEDPNVIRALYGINIEYGLKKVTSVVIPGFEFPNDMSIESFYALPCVVLEDEDGDLVENLIWKSIDANIPDDRIGYWWITTLPRYLFVDITRMSEEGSLYPRKIILNVVVSETLDVTKFCSVELLLQRKKWVYQLVGVLTHEGDLDSGQYYLWLKQPSGMCIKYEFYSERGENVGPFSVLVERGTFRMALKLLYQEKVFGAEKR